MTLNHSIRRHKIAVFWDYESARVWAEGIKIPLAEKLMDLVAQHGAARILRVYGRWQGSETILQGLYSTGFQLIHAAMGKKNSVDVMLAVDSIASCWENPDIDLYVLVSGDKDYISVVNYLKTHEKLVIIVGPAKASSEHLQLSASEFHSFEDLAGGELVTEPAGELLGEEHAEFEQTISYEEAISSLHRAIASAREDGKPSRYEVVDPLMRANSESTYRGYLSIGKPGSGRFRSFGDFVRSVQEDGKVVISSAGVFTELFLPDENPETDSDYVTPSESILPTYWPIVLERVEACFKEGKVGQYLYGRFMMLYNYTRSKKKDGTLPVSNSTIKDMLTEIVNEGLLVRQEDDSYRLADDYKKRKQDFLKKKGAL